MQINSWSARTWVSGPLQSGHTRISSKRLSTNFLHNKRQQAWIERCVNRHRPEARIAPGAAFDRILFSDQDDIRAYFDKGIALPGEMVRERLGLQCQANAAQHRKKAFGRANSSGCQNARSDKFSQRPPPVWMADLPGIAKAQLECEGIRPGRSRSVRVNQRRIARARKRLTQRPGRQKPAITAQALVAHRAGSGGAVRTHPYRRAGALRNQQRLIADFAGVRVECHSPRRFDARAITARNDARPKALLA